MSIQQTQINTKEYIDIVVIATAREIGRYMGMNKDEIEIMLRKIQTEISARIEIIGKTQQQELSVWINNDTP